DPRVGAGTQSGERAGGGFRIALEQRGPDPPVHEPVGLQLLPGGATGHPPRLRRKPNRPRTAASSGTIVIATRSAARVMLGVTRGRRPASSRQPIIPSRLGTAVANTTVTPSSCVV